MNKHIDFKALKPAIRKAVAPTIVATLVFFLTYYLFGAENSMIGPFATLSFLRFQTMRNHYACMIKNYVVYGIMALLAFFAVINLPLCILINGLALFWIAHFLIDEYNPTNYFPMGMALIFFQIAPVHTPAALMNRLAALGATFILVFLFVFILSRLHHQKDSLRELIRQGFENCHQQLVLAQDSASGERMGELHHDLCDINRNCSGEIYSYNRASLLSRGKVNWYCHFILVFQVINYLTLNHETEGNMEKARQIYEDFSTEFETETPAADYRRMSFRLHRPDLRSFRLRFALRQVITVTPCLVFAWSSHLPNVYWLVLSVFFMMIPFTDHTMQRVRQRVLGTIAGILICLGLFSLFPGFPARIFIMTLANFLIYGTSGYGPTVAYITCSALALQTIDTAVSPVLFQRLAYTLIGAVIALAANHFIFPIRVKKQISYLSEMLIDIQKQMKVLLHNSTPGDKGRRFEIDQLIVKSYLIFKRLENMLETLPDADPEFDHRAFEKEHMSFMAEYLSQYLLNH